MSDKPTIEERVSLLEKDNAVIAQMSETVDRIFSSLATLPGGEQGLLDRSKELQSRHSNLRKEFDDAKADWQKDISELKRSYYMATGAVGVIVVVVQHLFK